MSEIGKIFGSDIQTFTPETLLEQMVDSQEGTIFVIGTREVWTEGNDDDDHDVEVTFAQIKKVRSK